MTYIRDAGTEYAQMYTSEPGFDEEMPINQEESLITLIRAELEEVGSYTERYARASCDCGVCDSCLLSLVLAAVSEPE